MVGERRLKDMEQGGDVHVPRKDISEPAFGYGRGGDREIVLPGQPRIHRRRPHPAPGRAAAAAATAARGRRGRRRGRFVFSLSREEFMQIFFDDLELPQPGAHRRSAASTTQDVDPRRLSPTTGVAAQPRRGSHADAVRSRGRIALARRRSRARRRRCEAEFARGHRGRVDAGTTASRCYDGARARRARRGSALPFLDDLDLRYRNRVLRAGADRPRRDVLPDGRLGVDGRGARRTSPSASSRCSTCSSRASTSRSS